jgi:dUTP pyrophosphatase
MKYYEDGLTPPSFIYPYSKAIAQALVVPVPKIDVEEVTYEELQKIASERGAGKLGSSQK